MNLTQHFFPELFDSEGTCSFRQGGILKAQDGKKIPFPKDELLQKQYYSDRVNIEIFDKLLKGRQKNLVLSNKDLSDMALNYINKQDDYFQRGLPEFIKFNEDEEKYMMSKMSIYDKSRYLKLKGRLIDGQTSEINSKQSYRDSLLNVTNYGKKESDLYLKTLQVKPKDYYNK